jgi:hypothetical protein
MPGIQRVTCSLLYTDPISHNLNLGRESTTFPWLNHIKSIISLLHYGKPIAHVTYYHNTPPLTLDHIIGDLGRRELLMDGRNH